MATRLPCVNCRNTNGGRLSYWYVMGWEGEQSRKYRLRLCRPCVEGILQDLIDICDRQLPGGQWVTAEEFV